MSREYRLQKLLNSRHVWHPGAFSAGSVDANSADKERRLSTGFPVLDEWLGGGWPANVLIEFLLNESGVGELQILMPALAHLSQESTGLDGVLSNRIAWIAPPCIPYAPALSLHGLDIASMLVVEPDKQVDALWAMEQVLRSSLCAGVLAWFADIDDRSMRRLQLASETGLCWAVIFRPQRFAQRASPAPLRIQLTPEHDKVDLHILRNRFGPVGSLSIPC